MRHCLYIVVTLSLFGCETKPAVLPEPQIIRVPVDKIIQEKCKDVRPPAADSYPDDDSELAKIDPDDFFTLAKAYRAGRDQMRIQLRLDDVQIRACAGG